MICFFSRLAVDIRGSPYASDGRRDQAQTLARIPDPKQLESAKSTGDKRASAFGARAETVGRKNHYGSRSERGTRVAALFYSLIESAKLAGVEPRAYLREATLRAVRSPGTITLARDLKSSES